MRSVLLPKLATINAHRLIAIMMPLISKTNKQFETIWQTNGVETRKMRKNWSVFGNVTLHGHFRWVCAPTNYNDARCCFSSFVVPLFLRLTFLYSTIIFVYLLYVYNLFAFYNRALFLFLSLSLFYRYNPRRIPQRSYFPFHFNCFFSPFFKTKYFSLSFHPVSLLSNEIQNWRIDRPEIIFFCLFAIAVDLYVKWMNERCFPICFQ